MDLPQHERRLAFNRWLRTGLLPPARGPDGVEVKFNPYHDPRDGRFTFAPGNYPGSTSTSARRENMANARLAPGPGYSRTGRGGNIRAFDDPMTLQQTFPGLQGAPGGAIIVADNILNFTGPANEMKVELLQNWTRQAINDIKAVDPNWHYDRLGPVTTLQGMQSELANLRLDRAAAFVRVKGDLRPMQVETLRFIQSSTDRAYEKGLKLLKTGKLSIRLSEQEALGNYIDREVRMKLRERYSWAKIDSAGSGPVRVNRREVNSAGSEQTFRRPDARVGSVAYDVTLTQKTLATPQIRGFFSSDFRPDEVIIIRPSQLGPQHTYVIIDRRYDDECGLQQLPYE